jgi:pimeloyl-ACP methyl ester carboxylesterase
LFCHGSGSSRHSPRNRAVARVLNARGIGTFLLDLLTPAEEEVDSRTRHLRFDIDLLAERLRCAAGWLARDRPTADLPIGCFGASTGAAAALVCAARAPDLIRAIVSRGGRPDLAGGALHAVVAPTLLIVGGEDHGVVGLNEIALEWLQCEKQLEIVPGATHLFEEPGTLDQVARLARDWFGAKLVELGSARES